MKHSKFLFALSLCVFLSGCSSSSEEETGGILDIITSRDFRMGFSTWSYGPNVSDLENTYQFIQDNADIYAEQVDDKIPWSAWINDSELPIEFVNDVNSRKSRRIAGHQLLLSISLLNALRTDLAEDFDDQTPSYTAINDQHIEDAYIKHINYLMQNLQPDYLIIGMEVNELMKQSASKWEEYKLLMANVRSRLKVSYPNLSISASVTLHSWLSPDVDDISWYQSETRIYANNQDFAAISFYPFLAERQSKAEFQAAFDYLHAQVSKPIAIVETGHIAEDLEFQSSDFFLAGNPEQQKDYLETTLINAFNHNYEFVLWWSHRDYDALVAAFPPHLQDAARAWRDVGLLDENGNRRVGFDLWSQVFQIQ